MNVPNWLVFVEKNDWVAWNVFVATDRSFQADKSTAGTAEHGKISFLRKKKKNKKNSVS